MVDNLGAVTGARELQEAVTDVLADATLRNDHECVVERTLIIALGAAASKLAAAPARVYGTDKYGNQTLCEWDTVKEEKGMNFEWALGQMQQGNTVRRAAWVRTRFACLMPELQLPPYNTQGTDRKVNDRTAKYIGEDAPLNCRPYFACLTGGDMWQPGWLPSTEDLLANDWVSG